MRKKQEIAVAPAEAKPPVADAVTPQDTNTRIRRILEVTVDKLDWIVNGGLKQGGRPERMRDIKEALRILRDVGRHTLALDAPKKSKRNNSARRTTEEHTP